MMESANGKKPGKPKKSVGLTEDELQLLKKHIAAHKKPVDAAIALEIDRNTMQRVQLFGSGSQNTIDKIRKNLNKLYKHHA